MLEASHRLPLEECERQPEVCRYPVALFLINKNH